MNDAATPLMQIQDVVQQLAEATSAALRLDVEVYDRVSRVAATGFLQTLVGRPILKEGVIWRNIYGVGKAKIIVDNPGKDDDCRECPYFGQCKYKRAVYAAIEHEGQIVGVIGIIAVTEDQVALIEYNDYAMLEFVDKIAGLISSKLKEHQMIKQIRTYAELLEAVIDNIDKGVIIANNSFEIIDINNYMTRKLLVDRQKLIGTPILKLFPSIKLPDASQTEYQEIPYTLNNKQMYFLCRWKSIMVNSEIQGNICLIEDYKDTTEMAYAITANQHEIHLTDLIGQSPQFLKFKDKVSKAAAYDSTVLLTGETGSGKELFARAIHTESSRQKQPFVVINCGAIPETLIESELFGYEKGAFSGASSMGKHGKFFMANKGTVLLDEIETLPLYLQPKLLRVLEQKEIERVGGVKTIPVDIRIIAATNVLLDEMVAKKQFRADLFHRLNVVSLFIPPLRDRGEDIMILADYFITKYSKRFQKKILGLSEEVKHLFLQHPWSGNVRELQNAIEYAINMEQGSYISIDNLPFQFNAAPLHENSSALKHMEREQIKKALDSFGWSDEGRVKAAKYLGISRATIYRRIKQYHIEGPVS
jgi:transcriptional regulator with PAS, ATPase and Fis domain